MKKKFRMISAAAAALLAVAPVLSSSTLTKANVVIGGNVASASQTPSVTASQTININFQIAAYDGVTVKQALDSIKMTVSGANASIVNTNTDNYSFSLYKNGTLLSNPNQTIQPGNNYQIKVTNLKLGGITVGTKYAISGGVIDNNSENAVYDGSQLATINNFTSDKFTVYDKKSGSVSFANKTTNTDVTNGYVIYGNTTTVSGLASLITNAYKPKVYYGDATVDWDQTSVQNAIKDALKSVGVSVNGDQIPNRPASTFTVNVPATASNGSKSTLPVTVLVNTDDQNNNPDLPKFSEIANPELTLTKGSSNNTYNLHLSVNDQTTATKIASQFAAQYRSSDNNYYATPIYVKSSDLNTAVTGKYTVVLEALNPTTHLTGDLTVNVTVGNPDAIKTIEAGNDTAKIIMINGNSVTTTSQTLANGAKVATYGTVTINGVSYTRLNGNYSNQYVLTKYVNGSIKPSTKKTTTKTEHARIFLQKRAIIYNIDHKALSSYKIYSGHNVVAKDGNPVVYTLNNGIKALKLSDGRFKGQYIDIRNVNGFGVTKTVRITARIFNSRGRAISTKQYGRYIRRNKKIMTYGLTKIRGIRMYKLAKNVYVKAYNLR